MFRKLRGLLKALPPRGPVPGPRLCRQVKPRRREFGPLLPTALTVRGHHRREPGQPQKLPHLRNEHSIVDVALQCTGVLALMSIKVTLAWILICLGNVTVVKNKISSAMKQGAIKYDMWNALQRRLLPC